MATSMETTMKPQPLLGIICLDSLVADLVCLDSKKVMPQVIEYQY